MAATCLVDLKNQAVGAVSLHSTISSETDTDGVGVDCQLVEGEVHAGIQLGNSGDASTVIIVKLQESATSGGSYTDISGATKTFSASASANDLTLNFISTRLRTLRYVRATVNTAGGTPSVPISVSIFGQAKIAGSGTGYLSA